MEADRKMKTTSRTPGIFSAILLTLLWCLPFGRALALYQATQATFAETNSLNNYKDVAYSIVLLKVYGISLLAALGFAGIVFYRPRIVLWLPFCAHLVAVLGTIVLKPERVIVLFPDLLFPWPVALCVAATGLAAILHFGLNNLEKTPAN